MSLGALCKTLMYIRWGILSFLSIIIFPSLSSKNIWPLTNFTLNSPQALCSTYSITLLWICASLEQPKNCIINHRLRRGWKYMKQNRKWVGVLEELLKSETERKGESFAQSLSKLDKSVVWVMFDIKEWTISPIEAPDKKLLMTVLED